MQIAQALRQTTKPFVSLEFFPPAAESHLPEFYETVERLRSIDPLFLSVTYGAGGGKQQNTLNVTAELARRGFTVMAHLTCVGAEPQAISDFVSHLRAAGVHNVLALRGDAPRGVLSLCGANIPGKLYLELEAAHNEGGVEAVREAGLRFAARQIRQLLDCGAPGIHLYSLNKSEMCLRLVEEAGL